MIRSRLTTSHFSRLLSIVKREMAHSMRSLKGIKSVDVESQLDRVTVAAIQYASSDDVAVNLDNAERLVIEAATHGANIILLQELFSSRYFPIDQIDCTHLAISLEEDKETFLQRFQGLAKDYKVVLPISFFERCQYVVARFLPCPFRFFLFTSPFSSERS